MKTSYRDSKFGDKTGGKKFGPSASWKGPGRANSSEQVLHKATCSECDSPCQVPFKPTGNRPIFCSNCFKKDENAAPKRFSGAGSTRPSYNDRRPSYGSKPEADRYANKDVSRYASKGGNNDEQFKMINAKLDAILRALS